jgi:hypothetical protein
MPSTPARSRFGARAGSQAQAIDDALSDKPQTAKALAQRLGIRVGRVYSHLKHLVAKNAITQEPNGYSVRVSTPAKPKKAARVAGAKAKRRTAKPSRAISTRTPPVAVEYTSRGKRVRKEFAQPHVAKAFFAKKLKDGCKPAVKRLDA